MVKLMNTAKRILVTGGAGFVGSHLCERLLVEGSEVVCLDSLDTGSLGNVENLNVFPGFTFIDHDICEPLNFEFDLDEIYNLASPASPPHYQKYPIKTTKTNVLGSLNVLDLARKKGAKIFQASTSEVYGDPALHPQVEEYWGNVNPIGIRSCYDEGKRCAETLFFDYHRMHSLDIKVAMIFNTYGPRMNPKDGRVVSNFIVQALENTPITIYGTGSQTRSFCYVDNLVDGFIRLMASPDEVIGPINLGNPGEFTMLELAEKVLRLTGSTSQLIFEQLPSDDPTQRKPNIDKANDLLGWSPDIQLEEGLTRTIEHFEKVLLLG